MQFKKTESALKQQNSQRTEKWKSEMLNDHQINKLLNAMANGGFGVMDCGGQTPNGQAVDKTHKKISDNRHSDWVPNPQTTNILNTHASLHIINPQLFRRFCEE